MTSVELIILIKNYCMSKSNCPGFDKSYLCGLAVAKSIILNMISEYENQ